MTKAVRVEKDYLGTVVEYEMAETKVRPQPWGKPAFLWMDREGKPTKEAEEKWPENERKITRVHFLEEPVREGNLWMQEVAPWIKFF